MSYCPASDAFFCIECAKEHRAVRRRFWAWTYSFSLKCPWRAEWHPALDRLEFDGRHPWQRDPRSRRRRHGLSTSEELPPRWTSRTGPFEEVTDQDVRKSWDNVVTWWVRRYSAKGDINREWLIDPVVLAYLGDVGGRRILDAGCGNGYLSRILARRGANVVGIDLSPKLLGEATAHEGRTPLGIRFLEGDLAHLSESKDASFDLVVSNVVLQDVRRLDDAVRELYRVLMPGGRLVFSITHPAFDIPPARWVREPPDTERPEERAFIAVDRYFDRVAIYWGLSEELEVVSFHRPLRDFADALHRAGFMIARLEEPTPSLKTLERQYRWFADQARIPNFLVIDALKPRE